MAPPQDALESTAGTITAEAPQVGRPTRRVFGWIPFLLGFLTAVGPVSTDIYLPAFPDLEQSLHTSAGGAQMTLSVWFVGLAFGQMTMGPLSDRFGRLRPMMIGTVIYTIASFGCAMASDIWVFSAFRLIAALGASASLVIPSACVRDIAHGNVAARMMSQLVLVMGVVPILAPTIGGLVLQFTSWRSIFWASGVYGLVCIVVLWRVLPETLSDDLRQSFSPMALFSRYVFLMRDRAFITNAMIAGFSAFLSFTYLSAAASVFIHVFGFSPAHFGMMFGIFAVGMIGASQINGMLVGRVDANRMLTVAIAMAVVGTLILTGLSVEAVFRMHPDGEALRHLGGGGGAHPIPVVLLWLIIAALMISLAPTGIIGPNAMVGAMVNHPRLAGSAAAFIGTLQYVLGAGAGGMIGSMPSHTPLPMAGTMLMGAVIMAMLAALRPAVPAGAGVAAEDVMPMGH
ncbi:multidrug effflux MFS transporter [Ameyamaea chiangmaiensis]|uniref:Bcr/CflA family efflux transporter n=1 Tax=Ameyamaea chiangmaiensis TaxID=442969 RepID=A0A850PHH6_9PROT|nr:multidrug effflux MFS transporter [Ameyamaea chiangmaiensis]MBS4076381.1 multidrug effflux MFS transporter [Ameyamaea chiangmaiensis]NVN41696.1 multidrug effflux MFS transporter [Ameyamaea chiangmaiensis]